MTELGRYYAICRDKYPDDFKTILGVEAYSRAEKEQCAAECAYFQEHEELPEWGYIIERVEGSPDNYLFIHADLSKKQ